MALAFSQRSKCCAVSSFTTALAVYPRLRLSFGLGQFVAVEDEGCVMSDGQGGGTVRRQGQAQQVVRRRVEGVRP